MTSRARIRFSGVGDQAGGLGQQGGDPAGGDLGPGHVRDQLGGPLDGDVLEDQQVDGQGAQVRAVGGRAIRRPAPGIGAAVTVPHAHRQRWARCSVTVTVARGMSRTWRRSKPMLSPWPSALPQPVQAAGTWSSVTSGSATMASPTRRHRADGPACVRSSALRLLLRPAESVRGRRHRGVARVPAQPPLQLRDPSGQPLVRTRAQQPASAAAGSSFCRWSSPITARRSSRDADSNPDDMTTDPAAPTPHLSHRQRAGHATRPSECLPSTTTTSTPTGTSMPNATTNATTPPSTRSNSPPQHDDRS